MVFVKAHDLTSTQTNDLLERDFAYTIYKPQLRHFLTIPVLAFGLDQEWVADLVEVQRLAKYYPGSRHLLTVVDALSKYT